MRNRVTDGSETTLLDGGYRSKVKKEPITEVKIKEDLGMLF